MANNKNKKWWWISIGAIALLLIIAIIKAKNSKHGEKVYTEDVQKRDLQEIVSASGKIYPKTEVKISSDVSGQIVALYVKEGDTVKAGQLLAKIDPDAYVSQVDRGVASLNASKSQMAVTQKAIESAIAQKEQINSQLENAKAIFNRNKKLHDEGVISDVEFQASKASLQVLEANLKSANAAIDQAKENVQASKYGIKGNEAALSEVKKSLSRTSILAPTNGIISQLNVEKGERVVGTIQMAGTEMMRLANFDIMEVQAEVSENDILRVKLGNSVSIDVDAYPQRKFKGRVSEISNSSTTASLSTASASLATDKITNFIVKIIIDEDSYLDLLKSGVGLPFRPGMSASVDITTRTEKGVLCVPIQSVTTRENESNKIDEASKLEKTEDKLKNFKEVVFLPKGDTVRMVEVKTGIQDDAYIQILQGLAVGEKVVAGPYSAIARILKSGAKINIVTKAELNTSLSSDKSSSSGN